MRMTYRQWLRLCKAKGYKLDALESEIQRKGFSRANISKKARRNEFAPPELVSLAWKLPLRGPEDDFEMCWRGMASQGIEVPPDLLAKLGTPPPLKVDPQEIADGLAPRLNAVLSDISNKLDAILSGMSGKLDAVASSLRGKLDVFMPLVSGKLEAVATSVEHTDAKLDIMAIELKRSSRRTIRAVWAAAGCVALAVGAMVFLPGRSQAAPSAPCVNVAIVTSVGVNGELVASDRRSWLGIHIEQMGEQQPREQYVPIKPFPGQKLEPCSREAGERAIYGGCWANMGDVKPPCGRLLFRSGNECYRPVAADPQKPVGLTSGVPEQERR